MADFINTSDFETFLQLDDLKGNFASDLEKLQAGKPAEVDIEEDFPEGSDFADGDEDFSIDRFAKKGGGLAFEGEDDWVDTEAEESDEDVPETDEEETTEEGEVEAEQEGALDNDPVEYEDDSVYDVDYETVITLPDGRELTIEELSNGYVIGTDLTDRESKLQEHIGQFEERVSGLRNVLDLAQLEADKVISDYEGFDWEALAAEDPQAYVENSRFLERYKARKAELVAAQDRIKAEHDIKAQQEFQDKCVECVGILKREIPNWDESLYQNLMQYAIDLGAVEDEILKENRPSIFLALHKAYQFDKGKQTVMAKIKRPGAPRKVVKPGSKPTTSQEPDSAKAAKAFSEGRISSAEAFKYLTD